MVEDEKATTLKEVSSKKGKGRRGQKYQILYREGSKGKKNVGKNHAKQKLPRPGG